MNVQLFKGTMCKKCEYPLTQMQNDIQLFMTSNIQHRPVFSGV